MITFLTVFLLMLLSGSIFILGFFTITRGEIIELPNGEFKKEKEILGWWQLFWEATDGYTNVYYFDEQLRFKLKILEQIKPEYIGEVELDRRGKSLIFKSEVTAQQIRDIEFNLNCHVLYNDVAMFLYDKEPVYRFSEWVRKITNCYVCLSSIGGTIYYWLIIYYFPNFITHTSQKLIFWVIFCVSLSFINKVIKENFDNDKK